MVEHVLMMFTTRWINKETVLAQRLAGGMVGKLAEQNTRSLGPFSAAIDGAIILATSTDGSVQQSRVTR